MKHLWEYDHPYYCAEGYREHLSSWEEFKDEWDDADPDYNLLFRWDWHAPDPDDDREGHELEVFFVLQRKGAITSVKVDVTEADEPDVRAWLTERLKTLRAVCAITPAVQP